MATSCGFPKPDPAQGPCENPARTVLACRMVWRRSRQDSRHGEGESATGTIAQGRPGQEIEGGRGGARAAQGAAWQRAVAAQRHPARSGARADGEGRTRPRAGRRTEEQGANRQQEQWPTAGLGKKANVAVVAGEEHKGRHEKGPWRSSDIQGEAERARMEKA